MIWLIQIFIFSLFLRSNIYFIDTSISLLNIINIIAFIFIIYSNKRKIERNFLIVLFLIIFYYLIEVVYLFVFYQSSDQIKDFYYSSFILSLFILFYWGVKYKKETLYEVTYSTLKFIYFLMFVIVIVELIFQVHLPGSRAAIDSGFKDIPTAFFYNPNDFATVVVLFFPLIHFLSNLSNKRHIILFFLVSLFFILVTMSRFALIVLLIYPCIYLIFQKKIITLGIYIISLGFIFVIALMVAGQISPDNYLIERNSEKLLTIANVETKQQLLTDESSSLVHNIRFDVLKPIINKPENFLLGHGFISGDKLFANKLIPIKNPHSFWLEGIFNFGFTGFWPIILIIFLPLFILLRKIKRYQFRQFVIIQILFFILLVNIPSSIMCLPVFWIPIAIVYAILFNPETQTADLKKEIELRSKPQSFFYKLLQQ